MAGGCQTLEKVDQGLYQVADSISERDRVTGQRSLSLESRQQQIAKGNAAVEQLLEQENKQGRKINQQLDKTQYWRMVQIFDRIHQVSHLGNERWQPILIDRDSFNAFTTGGTYIVVHLELMKQLNSDDEVAAVLAHEIAHTVANHVFEAQSLAQVTQLANSRSAKRDGYRAAYTHEGEREADRIGVLYSALSGYDPMAASRIWKRQFESQGNRRAFFFHSHPVNSERAAENHRNADKVKAYYRPGQTNPNYATLLQDNVLWSRRQQEMAAGQGGGISALADTLFGAYLQHQQARQGAQQQRQHIQLVRYVQSRLSLVEEQRPQPDRWQIKLKYSGDIPLQSLTLGAQFPQPEGSKQPPQVAISQVKQRISKGQSFTAEFKHPALKPIVKPGDSLKLYLDDAIAAR